MTRYIVQILTMIKININEAKIHLSRYLPNLAQGETVLLCMRGVPIAEIRPLPPGCRTPRPIGLAKGTLEVPDTFFDPLAEDMAAAFNGEGR
jgi:antitoxin (DNA-binding transcriptional repressor) of toxin-antitoxin stability system